MEISDEKMNVDNNCDDEGEIKEDYCIIVFLNKKLLNCMDSSLSCFIILIKNREYSFQLV